MVRGQEGDHWKGFAGKVENPGVLGRWWRQDWINRRYTTKGEKAHPQNQCFDLGLEFIEANRNEDNWFLQIETFDPHEPFVSPRSYGELYPDAYQGPPFDWPEYRMVEETEEQVAHVRKRYAALLSMCDKNLGRVLDMMDTHKLWDDTMLIVNTDHGFMLGEHGWWAKNIQPFYEEISHLPLFIWDPRSKIKNARRNALVQTIDLAPTLLGFFGLRPAKDMQGRDLKDVISSDIPIRQDALFGMFGGTINCISGNHIYMRAPRLNLPPNNYTLMPMHMRSLYKPEELRNIELAGPFQFTKGCRVLKLPGQFGSPGGEKIPAMETLLFDISSDPGQIRPLNSADIENRMEKIMIDLLKQNDAPREIYTIYGLGVPG
jgi:hypothetical protein